VLCPGPVVSKNDGQEHWISPAQLVWLYRVDPRECVVHPSGAALDGWTWPEGAIGLYPRFDGDYSLPNPKEAS
jgi:hypothetical protein